jgi:hypothetical protein
MRIVMDNFARMNLIAELVETLNKYAPTKEEVEVILQKTLQVYIPLAPVIEGEATNHV